MPGTLLEYLSPQYAIPAGLALLAVILLVSLVVSMRRVHIARREATEAAGQLGALTSTMREGVVVYDMHRRLIRVNPAFERLTGYAEEDVRDQEFLQYIHPDDRSALLAEWGRLEQGGILRDQEYRVVTRTGQVRWCSSTWETVRDKSNRRIGFLGTEFDITERKLAEAEMRLDTDLFQAVIEVQQAVTSAGLDSATVMRVIAERSMGLTGASGAVIESIDGEDLVPQVSVGTEAPRLKMSGTLSGLAVHSGELQRSDDVSEDVRITHRKYQELGIRSLLVVPLHDDRHTLGTLKVVSPKPNAFSDRDAKALRLLGGFAGAALGHAAAFEGRQARLEERTRALQDSEQRFKQLVDVAQEGIWVADDRGMITYVNQRMVELLGYQNGAMLGRPVFDFIDAASRDSAQEALRGSAKAESSDLRFRRRDGTEVWGLVSGSPIMSRDGTLVGTVGMVTDITERKRAEDRLRRSAERLGVLHDLDQAILTARSPVEVGRAALGRLRRMVPCHRCTIILFDLGHGQAQLIAGWADGAVLPATSLPLDSLSPIEVLRHGTVRLVADLNGVDEPTPFLQQLRAEGMRSVLTVPLLVDGEAIGEINLASRSPSEFESEHRDIAQEIAAPLAIAIQHARLREELGRQAGELERRVAESGAALRAATTETETLLHAVSHDLRDPLRHIHGFAEMILLDGGPGLAPGLRHYANRIGQAAARMSSQVDDLVMLARVGRQDLIRREVDLGSVVADVVDRMQTAVEGREIDWRIEPLPSVDADPTLVRAAVEELVSNAVKFTRRREHPVVQVRPVESEGEVGIAIQDNGVGFRMAYAGKLFGTFQRLHRPDEFEGEGAGLALVHRIAQRHGGRVWAEAEPDAGATFFMTFGGRRR
ncbi:MAG TPA: PAS domain S-box protein [Gemmatimonadales bacterium]|jgi:PAS domain S-box-containing protein